MDLYIGLDLGTTGCKALVCDRFGKIHGLAGVEYELIFTRDGVEQDTEVWWDGAAKTLRESLADLPKENIKAISVSTQGITGAAIDRNGKSLCNALSWLDQRAEKEAGEIAARVGTEELFRLTGKPLYPYSLAQLIWMQRNRPEIYKNIWKYMLPLDYLNFRLTGNSVMDYSIASGTMAFDLVNHQMIAAFFEQSGVEESLFSQIQQWGTVIGRVSPTASEKTGLPVGLPVVLGAQDQRCAALGAGIAPDIGTASLGTSSAICTLISTPVTKTAGEITCCAVDDDYWMLESVIGTSGAALRWAQKNLFNGISFYEIDNLAASSRPGSNGLLFTPDLSANEQECGGVLTGIALRHTKSDIARAILEGIAFRMDAHIHEQMSYFGPWREVRLFGGGAVSRVWCQMISDIVGLPVQVPHTQETAALGAAIIAAAGSGAYSNVWEAGKEMSGQIACTYQPDAKAHEEYCKVRTVKLK